MSFQPGWGGDVIKVPVDPTTGLPGAPLWDAAAQLGSQLLIAAPGDTPWFTNRKIVTVTDTGAGRTDDCGATSPPRSRTRSPRDCRRPGRPCSAFLRGDPTNEGISLGQFRVRATDRLGRGLPGRHRRLVGSLCRPARTPPTSTATTRATPPSSPTMLRVRRWCTSAPTTACCTPSTTATGNEAWAFMPHDLFRAAVTGLGALSYQNGALPPFRHHYYVDSTPRVIDVDFGNQNWHSLLVGGLGKGGKSYYALDVTNPASVTNELTAASQYLWTFTDRRHGLQLHAADRGEDARLQRRLAGHRHGGLQQPERPGQGLLHQCRHRHAAQYPEHRLRQRREPVRARPDRRLHQGLTTTSSSSSSTAATFTATSGASTSRIRTRPTGRWCRWPR